MALDQATGTTMTFATTGFQTGVTFLSIGASASRGAVETTHLGTTVARTFEPEDLYDPGELTVTFHWDATEVGVTGGFLLLTAAETITIAWPNGSWAASGFCTAISTPETRANNIMEATATFKLTGTITAT